MTLEEALEKNLRLNRELEYYQREVNQAGAETLKAREEVARASRETMRARVMLKLVREVYRLGDFGGAEADIEHVVLDRIVENAMCDRAMLLKAAPHDDGYHFHVVCTMGLDGSAYRGREVVLRRPHRYCYTTGDHKREGQTNDLCAFIGLPFILWSFDPDGGAAILLGNQQESNARHPFDEADRELVETALSSYLDILYRKRENRRIERTLTALGHGETPPEAVERVAHGQSEIGGVQEAEIREKMAEGERLTGLLIVDRSAENGPEFVCYLRGSWSPGYRLLRTFRGRAVRIYKDVSRLIATARWDYKYAAPIVIYSAGAPELRRFPGIWPADLAPYGDAHSSDSQQRLRPEHGAAQA